MSVRKISNATARSSDSVSNISYLLYKENPATSKSISAESSYIPTDFRDILIATEEDLEEIKCHYFFSTSMYMTGLGNIWRFPIQAFLFGHASFIYIYLFFSLLLGPSLLYFELSLGQYSFRGMSKVFSMCPIVEGIIYSMMIFTFLVSIFYSVLNIHSLLYILSAFYTTIPFTICEGSSSNRTCMENSKSYNMTPEYVYYQDHIVHYIKNDFNWRNSMLALLVWSAICLILASRYFRNIRIILAIYIGFFLVLGYAFIASLTVKGSSIGLYHMFVAKRHDFYSLKTWVYAFEQTLVTIGLATGSLIYFGSRTRYHTPTHVDCFKINAITLATAIVACMTFFCAVGRMSYERDKKLDELFDKKQEVVFHVILSLLFSRLPFGCSHFTIVVFFIVFICTTMYSGVVAVYTMTRTFSKIKLCNYRRLCILFCVLGFAVSAIFFGSSAGKLTHPFSKYFLGPTTLVLVSCELICMQWLYGFKNYLDDIEFIYGKAANYYYTTTWVLLPAFVMVFLAMELYVQLSESLKSYQLNMYILFFIVIFPVIACAIFNSIRAIQRGDLAYVIKPRERREMSINDH